VLIGGDISGVQNFIYTLSAKGAAKTLRGRSFYLQLLNEAVLRYVLRELGLPTTNVIYSGGGHFYLLAPPSAAQRLADIQQKIDRVLVKHHGTALYLAMESAAVHLAPRNLEPTMLAKFGKDSPIDRLAELARTRPMNQYVTPQEFKRAQAAQSAALGILGRPIVLANESLLKRIPADVIHSLMADLGLRIRKTDNRVTVIAADGRGWMLKSD